MDDELDFDADESVSNLESRVEELELKIEELETESQQQRKQGSDSDSGCLAFPYSVGAALAVVISWETNHSVLLGLLHGLLSWVYVIYALIEHGNVRLL